MPDRIKYFMDEHVSPIVTDGLRRRGVDVLTVQEAAMTGASDVDNLQFASAQQRVFFTQDADLLRLHSAGADHHGILFAPQGTAPGKILQTLMLIYEVLAPREMKGQVEFI